MGDKQLLQRSFLRILATSGALQKGVSVHRHSQALDIKSELTQVKMFCFLEGEGKEGQNDRRVVGVFRLAGGLALIQAGPIGVV